MNAESVKARLKNIAVKDGGTMQDKLITYALERSIYRLSVSKYVDRFTLKGGIFLYALFDKQFARATRDIDFHAEAMTFLDTYVEDKSIYNALKAYLDFVIERKA